MACATLASSRKGNMVCKMTATSASAARRDYTIARCPNMAALLDRILCALGSRELPEPVHATLVPEKEGQPEPAAKLIPEPAKSVEETKEAPEARPEPEEAPGSPNESFAETEAVPEEAAEAPVVAPELKREADAPPKSTTMRSFRKAAAKTTGLHGVIKKRSTSRGPQ